MAAMFVVVLLAIASTCQGAPRARREAIGGKLDKSFDLLGLHMGLKYKDPAQPLKGGKLHLAIDDLKAYFKQAHSNKVALDIDFEGELIGVSGIFALLPLFKIVVHYSMVHSDGDGEEKGELMVERKITGKNV
eukprot:TRINITY_DN4683_c0_g1_i1.p1 TRINITY_DN4683_c0_g1~~TRINITY_DN4683_c0_g1_i1.p1  ORF type:complete len:133 (+),score=34.65 TRINITY_DN4683_c0_g1_i1:153-551(+)